MSRITIVGMGLIGTSMGLGLKKVGVKAELVGHDRDHAQATRAQKKGAVDQADWNLPSALAGASLVIIATPLAGVRQTLEVVARDAPANCVVTDTASVKTPVLAWAAELLPNHINFVGGHPLLRQAPAASGQDGAHADLFEDMFYCLCPAPQADEDAVRLVADLVGGLGARCLFMDAAEHDGLAGGMSHLPLLAAVALTELLTTRSAWRDLGQLTTSEFDLGTRLADTEESAAQALLLTNRDHVIRWVDEYMAVLRLWRERLAAGDEVELAAVVKSAREMRARWLRGEVEETSDFMPRYSLGGAVRRAFLGGLFAQGEKNDAKRK